MIERYRFSEGVSGGGFAPDEPPMMEGDIQGDWVKYEKYKELRDFSLEFSHLFVEVLNLIEKDISGKVAVKGTDAFFEMKDLVGKTINEMKFKF